jgi:hypothetical protein
MHRDQVEMIDDDEDLKFGVIFFFFFLFRIRSPPWVVSGVQESTECPDDQ